ncbi:hypothetical protein KXS07_34260 [Inquilinus limosus]
MGGGGQDHLYGGAGDDQIAGGGDIAQISASAGGDVLTGGTGEENFYYYETSDSTWAAPTGSPTSAKGTRSCWCRSTLIPRQPACRTSPSSARRGQLRCEHRTVARGSRAIPIAAARSITRCARRHNRAHRRRLRPLKPRRVDQALASLVERLDPDRGQALALLLRCRANPDGSDRDGAPEAGWAARSPSCGV